MSRPTICLAVPQTRRAFAAWIAAACTTSAIANPAGSPASVVRLHAPTSGSVIRDLLKTPEAEIDLAKAKVTIDRLIDPSIDAAATLAQLDGLASSLRRLLPPAASKRLTLDALRYHVYTASPWNGNRPYQYDLTDPLGRNIRNKLLTTYLSTRKGNCVSMPLLFIILGQKLGVELTAATAPNHVFVKYRDDDGNLFNLETTSGAHFTRDVWMRQQHPMTDKALASGIYMRSLSKKETVAVMVGTYLEFLDEQGRQDERIEVTKLAREHAPKDISLIFHEHQAYVTKWRQDFVTRYPTPNDIPLERRALFVEYESRMHMLFGQALALGWRPRDEEAGSENQGVMRAKSIQQP